MLRTTNGVKFLNAEDNIMHLGALMETCCSKLGREQLETSKKHSALTLSQTDCELWREERGKCNPRVSQEG